MRRSLAVLVALSLVAIGGTFTRTARFGPDDLVFSSDKSFDMVDVRGFPSVGHPGEPLLPAAVEPLVSMEKQVKQVLDQCGVSTSLYVPYLNFGRQLYKLTRQQEISGESFAMAAKVLLDKWAARGCDPAVLARVRTDVFNIKEPKA